MPDDSAAGDPSASAHGRPRLSAKPAQRYPRARLDTLADGIYAVAMTLLILDIRLPDDFRPKTSADLSAALLGLWPKLLPYVVSFGVLSLRWLSTVQIRTSEEYLGGPYIRWWLLNLLLTTCVPFTTIVVGRYGSFAPALWLYAGNTALIALASIRQLQLMPGVRADHHHRGRKLASMVLLASSLLCLAWSFLSPSQAPWAFLLNIATPLLERARRHGDIRPLA